jgi:hypothetical protein
LLGSGWEGLTASPLEVINAAFFYPELWTLTHVDHMIGEAVLAGPVIESFGLGAAYNARIVFSFRDGASGCTSERYNVFRSAMQSFPAPESIRGTYDLGARRLIVHYGDYGPSSRERIPEQVESSEALGEAAAFGDDVVYEIAKPQ